MSKEISLSRFARFIGSAYLLEACTKAKVLLLLSIIIKSKLGFDCSLVLCVLSYPRDRHRLEWLQALTWFENFAISQRHTVVISC